MKVSITIKFAKGIKFNRKQKILSHELIQKKIWNFDILFWIAANKIDKYVKQISIFLKIKLIKNFFWSLTDASQWS